MSNNTLHEKLIDIQQKLRVDKERYNKFGDFNYRNLEDIMNAVKPLLAEHKLTLTFYDEPVEVGGRVYIKAVADLADGTDKITVQAFAREAEQPKAKTDDAQLTGGTSSYARKYAANGLFLIDDNKDPDSDDPKDKRAKQTAPIKYEPSKTKPASDKQKEFVANLLRQHGVDKDSMLEYLASEYGLQKGAMTQSDAQMIIDDLNNKRS